MNMKKLGAGALALALCAVSAGAEFPQNTFVLHAQEIKAEQKEPASPDKILSSLNEADITESGEFDSNYKYTIFSDTIMVVSGSGDMDAHQEFEFLEIKSKIKTLIITAEDDSSVTSIGANAFASFSELDTVYIPDTVEYIGESAFSRCSLLSEITLPASLKAIGSYAFLCCSSIENIYFPENLSSISKGAFEGCSGLTNIIIPDSVTYIAQNAFSGCYSINSVSLGSSILEVSLENTSNCISPDAFFGDTAVTEITMHPVKLGDDMPETGVIASMFDFEHNGIMPEINSVTVLDGEIIPAFSFTGLSSLETVYLPDDIWWIQQHAFDGCYSLNNIVSSLPSLRTVDIAAFANCTSLKLFRFPDTLNFISDEAFRGCSSLTEISIPDSVCAIGYHAFADCTGVNKISLGSSIETISPSLNDNKFNSVSPDAFFGDTAVTEITMHPVKLGDDMPETGVIASMFDFEHNGIMPEINTVTVLDGDTLPAYSFADLSNLEKAVLDNSITLIEDYSFVNCTDLKTVEFTGTKEQWEKVSFDPEKNTDLANAEIIFADSDNSNDKILIGDVDGNGIVDLSDLTLLSMYLLKDRTLDSNALLCADVKADGVVDIADLATLKQIIMHAL